MSISEKGKTNKKWTSDKKYRDNYDRIFGKKGECATAQCENPAQENDEFCKECRANITGYEQTKQDEQQEFEQEDFDRRRRETYDE